MSHAGRLYLDYNASAPLRPQARAAVLAAMEIGGNASSIHAEGRAARGLIETARDEVAALAGASARHVVFTSGATEAAALALSGALAEFEDAVLLVGAGEHPCVLEGHGFGPDRLRPIALQADGTLDLADLRAALTGLAGRACVLALQVANNETGVVQPVAEAAALVRATGGLVVCDAVQGAGRVALSVDGHAPGALGVDALILSSHKIGGPQGAGALAMSARFAGVVRPLLRGGGQERGLRAGTENVSAIAGFGAAAREALAERESEQGRLRALRDDFEARLKAALPDAVVFGEAAPRLAHVSAFALPGLDAATLLMALDLAGLSVSSGSACSSGKVRASHVLDAMGVRHDLAKGALRVSFGWASAADDGARAAQTLAEIVTKMRARLRPAA